MKIWIWRPTWICTCGYKYNEKKTPGRRCDVRAFEKRQLPTLPTGGSVPSAQAGLTSLFGMGRGGSPPQWPPQYRSWKRVRDRLALLRCFFIRDCLTTTFFSLLGLFVPEEGSRDISTGRLRTSQPVHLPPINAVVSRVPQWKSYLGGGFALRCSQRLSRPNVGTRWWTWRPSRYARGSSGPVLSY